MEAVAASNGDGMRKCSFTNCVIYCTIVSIKINLGGAYNNKMTKEEKEVFTKSQKLSIWNAKKLSYAIEKKNKKDGQ